MPPDRTKVIEDSHPESHYRGDRKVDPHLVPEVRQPGRQRHVGEQTAEEDARLERARDVGLESPEDRVERGQQRHRRIAGVRDWNRERREQAEHDAQKREQDRDNNYLHAGTAAGDGEGWGAPGDGVGVAGARDLYPAAGSDGFMTFTYMRSPQLYATLPRPAIA